MFLNPRLSIVQIYLNMTIVRHKILLLEVEKNCFVLISIKHANKYIFEA
jgi:hypothetical protein